jgi:hypothetical protein
VTPLLSKGPGTAASAAKNTFGAAPTALAAILATVRSTVAGLQDSGEPYGVQFGEMGGGGATIFERRLVVVGTKALVAVFVDEDGEEHRLTEGQVAAIMTGFAVHEVAHIRYTQPMIALLHREYPDGKAFQRMFEVSNVLEDIRGEALISEAFPGIAPSLMAAMWFADHIQRQEYLAAHPEATFPLPVNLGSPKSRYVALVGALRYPGVFDFAGHESDLARLQAWGEAALTLHDPLDHLKVAKEIRAWLDQTEEAEASESEDSDEGDEDGEGDGQKSDKKSDKEGDGEGEGDGQSSEKSEGEGGKSESSDSDEGEGEGEGDGQPDSDESGDEGPRKPGAPKDGDLDAEQDTAYGDSPRNGSPSVGNTNPSSASDGSEDADEIDADLPDLDACIGEANRDVTSDELAQTVASGHEKAKKGVKRVRRYPGPGMDRDDEKRLLLYEKEAKRAEAYGKTVHAKELRKEISNIRANQSVVVRERLFARSTKGTAAKHVNLTASEANDMVAATIDIDNGRRNYIDSGYCTPTTDQPRAGQVLAAVINSARKGPGMPERMVRSGRIDRSRLARVSQGDTRVFVNRGAPAPQRVRVHLLVDCSGSMLSVGGRNGSTPLIQLAAQAARDLGAAIDLIPWAAGRVYGHTTDDHGVYVARIWEKGEDRSYFDNLMRLGLSGNEDGYAIAYVADDLLEEKTSNERGVVLVISDGYPAYQNGYGHTQHVVEYYRRKGLRVVAVSIAPAASGDRFAKLYGGDVVNYDPNTSVFARSLARVIGSSL